jgi:hypothetical protein
MTTENKPSKARSLARDQRVSAALAKHFNRSATVLLAGTSHKVGDLLQLITDRGDAVAAADAVKAEWQTAVAQANAKNDAVATMMVQLRTYVSNAQPAGSQLAVDLGFAKKRNPPTVETKALAAQKRRAKHAAKKAALAAAMATLDGTTPSSAVAAPKPASS